MLAHDEGDTLFCLMLALVMILMSNIRRDIVIYEIKVSKSKNS